MKPRLKELVYGLFAFSMPMLVVYLVSLELIGQALGAVPSAAHLGVFAMVPVLMVGWAVFVVDAFRSRRVPAEKRRLWGVLMIFAAFKVMPFYWWWYVRGGAREPRTSLP